MKSRAIIAAWALVPLAYLLAHCSASLAAGEGFRPAASLDDASIYFQYARQAAQGHWMAFQAGDPISTGVTGFLYLGALSALARVGLEGPWAAWQIGLLSWMACLAAWWRLREKLFPSLGEAASAGLFLFFPSLAALSFNGMESGLFLALLLWTAEGFSAERPPWRAWVLASLLAWCRPEGQLAAALFAIFALATDFRGRWLPAALTLAACAAPSALVFALSGGLVTDSVRAKTLGVNATPFAARALAASDYGLAAIKGLWMGLYPAEAALGDTGHGLAGNPLTPQLPPLLLLLSLFGVGAALAPGWVAARRAAIPLGLWLILGLAGQAWGMPVGWHQHRYLAAYFPALLLGAALGLEYLGDGPLRRGIVLLGALFALFAQPWFLIRSYQSAREYRQHHGVAAADLKATMPAGTPVAVMDSGILAYESGMRIVDLPGITDHRLSLAMQKAATLGLGPVFAELWSRPAGSRPEWALIQEGRPDFSTERLVRDGIFVPVKRYVGEGGSDLVLYRWNWARTPHP